MDEFVGLRLCQSLEASPAAPQDLRVLVVERDDDSRELMAEVFRAAGATAVALAKDAANGLTHLRRGAYELVVIDVGVPDASGLAMIDRAEAEGRLAAAAVVVCSADRGMRGPAVERGAAFLSKPLNAEKLVAAVRRAHRPA